jgi:hypothetical protein
MEETCGVVFGYHVSALPWQNGGVGVVAKRVDCILLHSKCTGVDSVET